MTKQLAWTSKILTAKIQKGFHVLNRATLCDCFGHVSCLWHTKLFMRPLLWTMMLRRIQSVLFQLQPSREACSLSTVSFSSRLEGTTKAWKSGEAKIWSCRFGLGCVADTWKLLRAREWVTSSDGVDLTASAAKRRFATPCELPEFGLTSTRPTSLPRIRNLGKPTLATCRTESHWGKSSTAKISSGQCACRSWNF